MQVRWDSAAGPDKYDDEDDYDYGYPHDYDDGPGGYEEHLWYSGYVEGLDNGRATAAAARDDEEGRA